VKQAETVKRNAALHNVPLTAAGVNTILDPTQYPGVDIGAQINNALAACAGACQIQIPAGTFNFSTTINVTNLQTSITGSGPRATYLNFNGAGDAILIQPPTFTVNEAGKFSDFTIDNNGGTATSGIHVVSTNQVKFYDVTLRNFTGSSGNQGSGFWFDDQSITGFGPAWSERISCINCFSYWNRKGWRFTNNGGTGSFGRFECVSCFLNVHTSQTGVSVESGALVYDSYWDISGNIDDSPSSGGTLFSIDGSSSVQTGTFKIRVESNVTSAHGGATCLNLASGATIYGLGWIECINSPSFPVTNNISTGAHFLITGGHDSLQTEFVNGIGPWLIPQTVNAQEGVGFNLRWDNANWQTNSDGGNNGGSLISSNYNTGEIDIFTLPSTAGTNRTLSNATLVGNLAAKIAPTGSTFPSLITTGASPFFAQGTTAMPTGALSANTCSSAVTVRTTGVTTSMRVVWNLHSSPVGVNGYGNSPVIISAWLTTGDVNFIQCATTAVTPGPMSVDWTVF